MGTKVTQGEIAVLFGRKQSWVSKRQTRTLDPLPRDMAGAIAWGKRNGLLGDGTSPAASRPMDAIESADLALKQARLRQIQQEVAVASGDLRPRDEVEWEERRHGNTFRIAVCSFPFQARPILERHVFTPATVEAIMKELEPLAAELLNKRQAEEAIEGMTKQAARAMLEQHVEDLLKWI